MSFSLALPINRKFFERTLVHESLAATGACDETAAIKERTIARTTTSRFVIDVSFAVSRESIGLGSLLLSVAVAEETTRFSCRLYK